jgi:hypothetical protein
LSKAHESRGMISGSTSSTRPLASLSKALAGAAPPAWPSVAGRRRRSVPRQVLVYDDGGRLTEDQWRSSDVLTRRVLHTYDADGRTVSTATVDRCGTKREAELCRYGENGRKSKVVFLPVPESTAGSCSTGSCGTMYGVEGSDVAYSTPGATTSTTTYDERELPSDVTFRDASHGMPTGTGPI